MGVCVSGLRFGCAPALLAWLSGCVCSRARAPLAPTHFWDGCAVWVCGFRLGFQLRPATPGWGVGLCVGWCARSACTPPLLAVVRGVAVWVWARASAAPRHSKLQCWDVRVCVRAPLAPSHYWHGCAVWVCVFRLGFRLRPATPGWGVRLCVCSCARSACTQPLLARVRGVGACVRARVSAAPRHCWLGCWAVRVCVRAPLAPRHSWHGCAVKPQTSTTARACDGSFITFAITLQFVSNRHTSSPSCWLLPFNAILVSACLHAHEGTS